MAQSKFGLTKYLALFILLAGIAVAVYLVQFTQIFKPKATSSPTCTAYNPQSFKDCLNRAQDPNDNVNQIEVTNQITCSSKTECSNSFVNNTNMGGFILNNRTTPLVIFGTPGSNAGFKRVQNYDYILFWIGQYGTEVSNITLKDLIFDETTSECDFLKPNGESLCVTPLSFGSSVGSKVNNVLVDHVTILHSKNHSIQVANSTNLTIKNSIIYDSQRDGIWFDGAYPRNPDLSYNCPNFIVCPIDENIANKQITIENNLIAESHISAVEFAGIGTEQNPNRIKGNLFVHNHRNAKYVVLDGCDGHCPGGQVAIPRSKWVIIEDNVIRDGVIDSIKPVDNYNPSPGAQNKTYDSLGLVASGIELSSQISNIIIRNNQIYNFKGIAFPARGTGIFADYIGPQREVDKVSITSNNLYSNGVNIAAAGISGNFENIGSNYGFTFQNNTINNPAAGINLSKAFIFTDPPICVPQGNPNCESNIIWYSNNYPSLNVRVKENPNSLVAQAPNGSQKATWISQSGVTLTLGTASQVLSEARALSSGSPTKSAVITANPNPCLITSGETCTSTISWSSQDAPDLKIRIKEVPGSLFANAPYGSQAAPWIAAAGATFEAYSGDSLLASLFVRGQATITGSSTPSPTPSPLPSPTNISANPNPCTITSGSTCTSTITWNFQAGSDVKIRIKEVPGSLFANAPSGSQAAPWISASGATFQAYVNGNLSQELFVKGINSNPSPSPSLTPSPVVTNSPSPAATPRRSDLNSDGSVNVLDYNIFIDDYKGNNLRSDINGNGRLDIFDYNVLYSDLER